MYEDELLSILSPQNPATKGHLRIVTQKSLDSMSEEDFAHVATACSFASITLFEAAGGQGTNVIINEEQGVVSADVVARTEGDLLHLRWDAHQGMPEELDDIARRIREQVNAPTQEQVTTPQAISTGERVVESNKPPTAKKEEESYFIRQLRRRP